MVSPKVSWVLLAVVCWLTCTEASARWRRQASQLPTSPRAVEAALRSPRYVQRQISCLLNEAPCDNIGTPLKRMMPGLIRGYCQGCSQEQYATARRVMTIFSQRYPSEYSQIYYKYINQG